MEPADELAGLSRRNSYLAISLSLAGGTFCTLYGFFMKLSQIDGYGSSVNFGLVAGLVWTAGWCSGLGRKPDYVSGCDWLLSVINGIVLSGLFNFLYVIALDYITLGDCISINYFSGFAFSLVFELIHLRMRPHPLTVIAGVTGLSGMVCICRPDALFSQSDFTSRYLVGSALSGTSGLFGAGYFVFMHRFNNISPSFHAICYSLGTSLCALPQFASRGLLLNVCGLSPRLWSMAGALCFTGAAYCCVSGSQLGNPSASFVIKLISVVTGYLLQAVFLPEPLNVFSVVGGSLICVGIVTQSFVLVHLKK